MKIKVDLFLLLQGLLPAVLQAQSLTVNIAVASDVHVMAPSLLIKGGSAFDFYVKHDRKMLKESPFILDELTKQLLNVHPQFLLITGDLTKDGEDVSHHYLIDHCLTRLKEAGITVLVIPGNHDVNNPHANSFDGDTKKRVKCVSAQEFSEIYADYGYGKALARDKYSLSYVYQLTPTLRILAIDACKYEQNDFEKDICCHSGRIKPETLEFIKAQMADAHSKGIRVIGMMHHGLIEHWKYQNKMIPGYVVDDWKKQAANLSKLGLEVIFTGHSHAQDIVHYKSIYDVETGSTVSYPSPYRLVALEDNTLSIHSRNITHIDFDTKGVDFPQYALINTKAGFKTAIASLFPSKIPDAIRTKAVNLLADAMSDNYRGDEKLTQEENDQIKQISKELRKYSFKWSLIFRKVSRSLWSDKAPADNELLIHLNK